MRDISLNLTTKDKPELLATSSSTSDDVTPIGGTTIRRPRPSSSTLEFTSPSQNTIMNTQPVVPVMINESGESDKAKGQSEDQSEGRENEGQNVEGLIEGQIEEEEGPEELQMGSHSFLIEVI